VSSDVYTPSPEQYVEATEKFNILLVMKGPNEQVVHIIQEVWTQLNTCLIGKPKPRHSRTSIEESGFSGFI
jgi:hypothetical protein